MVLARKEVRQLYDWAFAGEYPEIWIAQEIIDEIVADDPKPMFLTLPFSETNAVATDGMRYTAQFNEKLVAEINDKRPYGNMGHLRLEDRENDFDVPAGIWLGAMLADDGRVWAKAYIFPDVKIRQLIRTSRAAKRPVGTSIYGFATDERAYSYNQDGTYEIDPQYFDLESLDFGPKERVALQIERPTLITAHMDNDTQESTEEDNMPLTPELIAQMTVEQANNLPTAVRDAIIAQYAAQNETVTQLQHFKDDNEKLTGVVAQLQADLAAREAEVFDTLLDAEIEELVNVEDEGLREAAKNAVLLHMAGKREIEPAKEFLAQYVDTDSFKNLAKAVIAQLSGGAAVVGGRSTSASSNGETLGAKYEADLSRLLNEYGVKGGK